jgi:hypothetical protein
MLQEKEGWPLRTQVLAPAKLDLPRRQAMNQSVGSLSL